MFVTNNFESHHGLRINHKYCRRTSVHWRRNITLQLPYSLAHFPVSPCMTRVGPSWWNWTIRALSAQSHKSPLTLFTLDCYYSHSHEAISGDVVIALYQSLLSLNTCRSTVCPSFCVCLFYKASELLPEANRSKYHYQKVWYVPLVAITMSLQNIHCCISYDSLSIHH